MGLLSRRPHKGHKGSRGHKGGAMSRVFLLSPANCNGRRAKQALSPKASFALAAALRSPDRASLGEFLSFISCLYFRGQLPHARRVAGPPEPGHAVVGDGVHVITPNAGLRAADTRVTPEAVRAFAGGDVNASNARYRRPLEASARALLAEIGPDCDVVLLGSIASPKYVDVLTGIFGERLRFPAAFVGRGDMSRGGLLLRHANDGGELEYLPGIGARSRCAAARGGGESAHPPGCRARPGAARARRSCRRSKLIVARGFPPPL